MHFASDNSGPVHPRVMEALARANEGYAMPYGNDGWTDAVTARVREIFEAPEAVVFPVATGTGCNALILATLCNPWQTIFCSELAHIEGDECGAPEFYTGGAKLTLVPAKDALMTSDALRARVAAIEDGVVHNVQRGPVSLTTVSERGTVYAPDHVASICAVAQEFGLPVHMDGARFANAIAATAATPADLTWRAGVDALSFGGTKNGLLGAELAIFFGGDARERAWEFELRRKRAGHLFSKSRFLSAQMLAYLDDDLWLDMARAANAACADLVSKLERTDGVDLLHRPQANIVYCAFPRGAHRRLRKGGAQFYSMGSLEGDEAEPVAARLVCDWSAASEHTERFVELLRG